MSKDWSQESKLLYEMYRVNNAINTTFDAYISISQSRFEILALIYQEIEISQGDLQKKVTLDKAAVARHLKQLEDNKIVARRKKDGDNRIILVQLTDYGKELIESSQKEKEYFAKELLNDISHTDLTALRKILIQLNNNVERMKENV
ncbi:MarR family transcriptional regulator [Paenibacillus sp. FSL R7-0273]|uniref:MarR family winged helix-turn-helix transcriptional regulator n=1 Tax=Paenibacillus sp. FSL R7-0273 TaxID=1536772 RepID=UPI0004F6F965|nr:MarR family transcriptional regulator [Paenibacillus sp. FSL R7-0273]AIQ47303.1 MarR family transcriptional regulator [Paenibacillus sp. FSL R7-0273]OMF91646.1 transcriptional regulator [Paenibacillus sp. FSL R7-0273]